jgi:pyridoxal/pyridoxine/pyridoxamine kinase
MHSERARRNDYPGTGDLFSSVLLAYIIRSGRPHDKDVLQNGAAYASRFTADVIDYSLEYGDDEPRRDGVLLEGCLGRLVDLK